MDPFDIEEADQKQQIKTALTLTGAALGDGRHALPGGFSLDSNLDGGRATAVAPLPDALPGPTSNKLVIDQTAGGGLRSHADADPFEQEESRVNLQKAIGNGEDLAPLLRRTAETGAYQGRDLAPRGPAAAPDTTFVGGRGAVGADVTREQWDRLRAEWIRNYPTAPMPAHLQTWQGYDRPAKDEGRANDQAADAARVARAKREGSANPALDDPAAIAAARADFQKTYGDTAAVPTQLQGTVSEREAAGFNNFVTYLRAKLPAEAGNLTDQDVFARFAEFEPLLGPKDAAFARGLLSEAGAALGRGWTGLAGSTLGGGTGMLATAAGAVAGEDAGFVRGLRRGEENLTDYYGRRGSESGMLRKSDELTAPGPHFDKWRWWVSAVGENAPQMAVAFGTGGAANAVAGAAGLGQRAAAVLANLTAFGTSAAMEGTNAYQDIRARLIADGTDPTTAARRAAVAGAAVGLVNGAIELIPFNEIVLADRAGMRRLFGVAQKVMMGAGKEAGTEAVQELVTILGEYHSGLPWDPNAVIRMLESAAVGAVMGGGTDAAMEFAGGRGDRPAGPTPPAGAAAPAPASAAPSPGAPGAPPAGPATAAPAAGIPTPAPGDTGSQPVPTPPAAVAESGSNNPGGVPQNVNPGNTGALTGEELRAETAGSAPIESGSNNSPAAGGGVAPPPAAAAERGSNNPEGSGGAAVGEGGAFAGVTDPELAAHVTEYNRLLQDDGMGPARRDAIETDLLTLLQEQARRRGGAAAGGSAPLTDQTPPPSPTPPPVVADPQPPAAAAAAPPPAPKKKKPKAKPTERTAPPAAAAAAAPAEAPAAPPAAPERNDRAAPERTAPPAADHPADLADSAAVGEWYGRTFGDEGNAAVVQAMLSMSEGRYVLADVPLSDVRQPVVSRNDKDESKIDAISKLDAAARAGLPPAVLFGGRQGKLDVADGAHRFNGLLKAGAATIRGYVPEAWANRKKPAAPAAADHVEQQPAGKARASNDLGKPEPTPAGTPLAPAAESSSTTAGGARLSVTRGASAPRSNGGEGADNSGGRTGGSSDRTSPDAARWDFTDTFPAAVLDTADAGDADALARRGISWGDDGRIDDEAGITVATRDELVGLLRARNRAGERARLRMDPTTGRALTTKQIDAALAESGQLDGRVRGTLGEYEAVFGEAAAAALRKHAGRVAAEEPAAADPAPRPGPDEPVPAVAPSAPEADARPAPPPADPNPAATIAADVAAAAAKPAGYGAANKLVSADRAAELRKLLRAKLGQLNATVPGAIDPTVVALGAELAVFHVEAGARKFADFARAMVADLGDAVVPYLRSFYLSARSFPGAEALRKDMDGAAAVDSLGDDEIRGMLAPDAAGATGQPVVDGPAQVAEGERPGGTAVVAPAGGGAAGADVRVAPADQAPGDVDGPGGADGGAAGPRGEDGPGPGEGAGDAPGRPAKRGKRRQPAGAGADGGAAARVAADGDRQPADPNARNHLIDPSVPLHPLGEAAKVDGNLAAVRLLKELEAAGRNATPEEKATLARYVGWGGLPGALDDTKGSKRAYAGQLYGDEATAQANWEKKWGKRYDAVKAALTPAERDDAKRSTINAHYTSVPVVRALWDLAERLGFKGGRALENSAGVGHFLGLAPQALAGRTAWTAVERDAVSGRILAKLYPRAQVLNEPFQDAKLADGTFDLVIGNVPFAKDGPADKRYPRFSLHNYFIARSVDLVKPGGLVVEITSTSTLDGAASLKFREWAAERADLVFAARLPNDAFAANAGTEVTTDVLVYRRRDGTPFPLAQGGRTTLEMPTHDGKGKVDVNEYFHANPDNILGLVSLEGSMRGRDEPAVLPRPGVKLADALAAAVARAPADVTNRSSAEIAAALRPSGAAAGQKENSYQVEGTGKAARVRQVRGRLLVEPEWAAAGAKGADAQAKRAADWVGVRDAAKGVITLQLDAGASDADVAAARKLLNDRYDAYAKKHGPLTGRGTAFLADDPEFGITAGLEYVDSVPATVKGKDGADVTVYRPEVRKADIFTKRTTFPRTEPASAENVGDAIAISQSWRGTIDMAYVGKLAGVTAEAATADAVAKGLVFIDPDGGRVVAPDEYLSGNVRAKLVRATAAAAADAAGFRRNVDALTKVQPAPLSMGQITVRVGSTWMPTKVIAGWIDGLFGVRGTTVDHVEQTNAWIVGWGFGISQSAANHNTWGGGGVPAVKLIEDALGLKATVAYDPPAKRGESPVKNPERTIAAQAAQDRLQQHFKKWVQGSEFVPELERVYNDTYNAVVLRRFQPPTFTQYPGQSELVTLRDHQRAAVTRGTIESYYLAHSVGTGKTYTIVATAMEWRRLGLARKPLIVAQNATVTQIVESFKRLYPGSNVLSPTEADFQASNRRRLLARIATGDYDAVVLAHSQFELLPDDPGRVRAYAKERIADLEDAIREQKAAKGLRDGKPGEWSRDPTVKELEKAKEALETRLDKLADRKADDMLTFEQLGVDGLLVDEAHRYKKLEFTSQMDNIKGLDRGYSQRGFGLYMKTRFIQERNQGKGVVLASGTPITNTLAEAWNCVRYVRPDLLRQYKVENFDDFATLFAQAVTQMEMSAAGWKMETRLASFTNADELVKLFRSAADVINPEEVDLPRPGLRGGKPETVAIEAHPRLRSYMDYLIERYRAWTKLSGKEKRELSHEPLVITGLAKRAALDLRLVDSAAADDPGSKLAQATARMLTIYKATGAVKGAQCVFGENNRSSDDKFDLWAALADRLVAGGVPRSEIASIYDHDTKPKRKILFDKVNAGTVRFVFGSTDKLGVGVNIQERLAALHHLDAPWRPSDIEQREGRILRQGNTIETVDVFRYGVKNTFDAGLWQRLAMKQRFINQVLRGEVPGRTFDDAGGDVVASFDEAAAFISGDPRVMEKIGGEAQLRKLEALRYQHENDVVHTRQKMRQYRADIPRSEREAADLTRLLAELQPLLERETPTVSIDGAAHEGKEAVTAALEAWQKARFAEVGEFVTANYSGNGHRVPAGTLTVNGVDVEAFVRVGTGLDGKAVGTPDIVWTFNRGPLSAFGNVSTGPGLHRSVVYQVPSKAEEKIKQAEAFARRARKEIVELEAAADRPFEHQDEFDTLTARVAAIDAELAAERAAADAARDAAAPATADLLDQDPDQLVTERAKQDLAKRAAGGGGGKGLTTYSFLGLGAIDPTLLIGLVKGGYHWLYPPVKGSGNAFADATIETRFAEAKKGIQAPPWRDRLKLAAEQAWAHISRPFALLPVGARYAEAKRILLWLQKQKDVRQHDAVRALDQVVAGMDADGPSYDLFARKVILDDLAEEADRQTKRGVKPEDVKLPFGFTPAIVAAEKARADAAAATDLVVSGAVTRRDVLWKAAKKEYADAMKAIGFDAGKKMDREHYFRHQVLAYAQLRKRATTGTGERLQTPTGRGFLKFREGSQLDINADYLQAEFEILGQMMFDTQAARGIRQIGNFYDRTRELKKAAADANYKAALAALAPLAAAAGKTPEQVFKRNYHWKQGKGFGELYEAASFGHLPDTANGDWAGLLQAMADVHDLRDTGVDPDASLAPARMREFWRYLSWLVRQPSAPRVDAAATSAKLVLKGVADKKAGIKALAGEAYVEWRDLIPDGETVWQPRPGTQMYLADTIPARLAQDLLTGALASATVSAKDIKKVVAQASPFPGFVIPEELAATLDVAFDRPADDFLAKASAGLLSRWKEWVLLNPRRALKFNIRNLSGDADAVFAFNPNAFKHVPQAARELWAHLQKGADMTPTMRQWFERGGMQTMLTVQELPEINTLDVFKRFDQSRGLTPLAKKAWQAWWKKSAAVSNGREAILRYANFLSYREQIAAGKGRPANFGASIPEEVMALHDHADRAFILSNEVAGAYDSIGEAGKTIRRHWYPFWSFTESNFKRYWRGMKNAARDGEAAHTVGRLLLRRAASPYTYVRVGTFGLKALALWSSFAAWNWLMHDDEEQELPPEVRARPHVVFGRDKDGKVLYFDRLGSLQDILDWFGTDEVPQHVRDWASGRKPLSEVAGDVALAAPTKAVGGLNPFWKLAAEMLSGKSLFPNPFDPRTIRDKPDYLARQFSVDHEFKALTDRPARPYWQSWADTGVYRADPDQVAYYATLDRRGDYLKARGKGGGGGDSDAPRTQALRQYKLAVRYEDKAAAARFLAEYVSLGGTNAGLRQSLLAMDPYAGMSKAEARAFYAGLSADERVQANQARRYYTRVLIGAAGGPDASTN